MVVALEAAGPSLAIRPRANVTHDGLQITPASVAGRRQPDVLSRASTQALVHDVVCAGSSGSRGVVDGRIERPAPQGRPFCYSVVCGLGD
jgi:hypothetical protein